MNRDAAWLVFCPLSKWASRGLRGPASGVAGGRGERSGPAGAARSAEAGPFPPADIATGGLQL